MNCFQLSDPHPFHKKSCITYTVAYIYCAITNPDILAKHISVLDRYIARITTMIECRPTYCDALIMEDHLCKKQVSVPQTEYTLGGSNKKGSHVYFLLIVAMVLLLWHEIALLWHQVTMVALEQHLYQNYSITQKTCNRKYTWLPFSYCPLVGILFISSVANTIIPLMRDHLRWLPTICLHQEVFHITCFTELQLLLFYYFCPLPDLLPLYGFAVQPSAM